MKIVRVFVMILLPAFLAGQTATWKAFSTANTSASLCSYNVTCITRDSTGNLWFGTSDGGVSRYKEGVWTNYSVGEGLCDPSVNSISVDPEGTVWFGTWAGLSKFDGSNWTTYTRETTHDSFQGEWVFSVLCDSSGTKWLGTVAGLYRLQGSTFVNYVDPFPGDHDWPTCIAMDSHQHIWCGSRFGMIGIFDGAWTLRDSIPEMSGNWVTSIVFDSSGNQWIGCDGGGLFKLNGNSYTRFSTADGLANDIVSGIALDRKGNKWISTWGGGLSKFNDTTWVTFTHENSGLKSNYIGSIYIDPSGKIWLGTYDGLSVFDGNTWNTIQSNGLQGSGVYDVVIDKSGHKWFATSNGFSEYDGSVWKNYTTDNGLIGSFNSASSFAIDSSGIKWFGTYYGLSRFDGEHWMGFTPKNTPLADTAINRLAVDRDNHIWVSYFNGYGVTRVGSTPWQTFNKYNSGLVDNYVLSIACDPEGKTWFGTKNGVSVFNGTDWITYDTLDGLAGNIVRDIVIDSYGNKWFGTDRGLSKFDGSQWTTYNTPGAIRALAVENNIVYAGTPYGMYRFDGSTWSKFDYGWGICTGFFNISNGRGNMFINSVKTDQDGSVWIGSVYGISRLSFTDPVIFSVSPASIETGWEGGSASYWVISNVSWTDTCTAGWCTPTGIGTGGNNTVIAQYTTTLNTTRTAKIQFTIDGFNDQEVSLTQTRKIMMGVKINPADGGTVEGTGNYNYGDSVYFHAVPSQGYSFSSWSLNGLVLSYNRDYATVASDDYMTLTANFTHSIGIEENDDEVSWVIYPNPAGDVVYIRTENVPQEPGELSVFDMTGRLVHNLPFTMGGTCSIDVSGITPGSYYIRRVGGRGEIIRKLMIIR